MQNYEISEDQNKVVEKLIKKKKIWCIGEVGSGKTIVGLEIIKRLKGDNPRILIVAPLLVCTEVWNYECDESFKLIKGIPKKINELIQQHDKIIINPEKMKFLKGMKFDVVIVDESTKFKNCSNEIKILKDVIKDSTYSILLTGTPATTASDGVYAQIDLLNINNRLAYSVENYIDKYIEVNSDFGFPLKKDINYQENYDRIINCFKDNLIYLKSFKTVESKILVRNFKIDDVELSNYMSVFENTGSLYINGVKVFRCLKGGIREKLKQIHLGFLINGNRTIDIHSYRLNALKKLLKETIIDKGENVIIFIRYVYERELLETMIKKEIDENYNPKATYADWNSGRCKVFLLQYQSASHGLNLQHGGHVGIWYGFPNGYEFFSQANGRILRSGQKNEVRIYLLNSNLMHDSDKVRNLKIKRECDRYFVDEVRFLH